MTDLLEKMTQAERDEEALDARIDALAEAALSGASDGDRPARDPAFEAARLRAAYAPLSSEAKATMVARIAREVRAGSVSVAPSPELPPSGAALAETPGRVLVLRRVLTWALPAVAAAAAVSFVVWGGDSPSPFALEPYRLEVASGTASAARGAVPSQAPDAEPLRLEPSAPLVLMLRPERPVANDVAAHAFVRDPSGNLRPLAARVEAAPSGALRLFVSTESGWPERGELVIWIGAAAERPAPAELTRNAPVSGARWQRIEQSFVRAEAR